MDEDEDDDSPSKHLPETYLFIWKIENILWKNYEYENRLHSPIFKVNIHGSDTEWCFGPIFDLKRLKDEGPDKISVSLEVSCVTADGILEPICTTDYVEFAKDSAYNIMTRRRWGEILSGDTSKYLPGDCFTLQCKLKTSLLAMDPKIEYTAITHIEKKKIVTQVIVKNFSDLHLPQETELSPSNNEIVFYKENDDSEYLSFGFCPEVLEMQFTRCVCKLNVLDSRANPLGITEEELEIQPSAESMWKFLNFIKLERLKVVQPDGALNLLFEFTYDVDVHSRIVEERHATILY